MRKSCWIAIVVLVIFAVVGCLFLGKIGPWLGGLIVGEAMTESNVTPETFPRFQLPQSAKNIGYWEDGYQFQANFNLPEEDFINTFSSFKFREIVEKTSYPIWKFGDPTLEPKQRRKWVDTENGLIHDDLEPDGGGYLIVFDRNSELVSIHYTTH